VRYLPKSSMKVAMTIACRMIGSVQYGAKTAMGWNLASDLNGGPQLPG
jgi:hypothetical protein